MAAEEVAVVVENHLAKKKAVVLEDVKVLIVHLHQEEVMKAEEDQIIALRIDLIEILETDNLVVLEEDAEKDSLLNFI